MGLCRYPYQVMEILNTFPTDGAKAEIDKVDSIFLSPFLEARIGSNAPVVAPPTNMHILTHTGVKKSQIELPIFVTKSLIVFVNIHQGTLRK